MSKEQLTIEEIVMMAPSDIILMAVEDAAEFVRGGGRLDMSKWGNKKECVACFAGACLLAHNPAIVYAVTEVRFNPGWRELSYLLNNVRGGNTSYAIREWYKFVLPPAEQNKVVEAFKYNDTSYSGNVAPGGVEGFLDAMRQKAKKLKEIGF